MSLLANFPLIAAIVSILSAQAVKAPIQFVGRRSWQTGMAFSTGGMPSSHSAAMAGLATALGIEDGLDSPAFAVAAVVGMIIMFDAAGVRRHAGLQASVLNRFLRKMPDLHGELHPVKELKELLGHRPIEVFAGAIWGIGIGVAVYYLFYA
ncbi:divergent PAP2 family protein [Cohnella hashimotonis]|uniref:Divergent PAP2 family protein n=1 Tax=Cohnella hashimotonis TaxID=2826895 RepID=A0ABT6TH43_9BACL|nr:divergent PAP2 family protein [Cohnella hashimotonis]MDI4646064.1 divergent PAP2 family protein [Cohnella hashimotonis]